MRLAGGGCGQSHCGCNCTGHVSAPSGHRGFAIGVCQCEERLFEPGAAYLDVVSVEVARQQFSQRPVRVARHQQHRPGLFRNDALNTGQRSQGLGAEPGNSHLGLWVIAVPVIGGLIVGLMARFGSEKIRGHGIPEAIEAILMSGSQS